MTTVKKGAVDQTFYFKLVDSAAGTPETGLTIANIDATYVRNRAAAVKNDLTALAAVTTAHTDNQGIEIDATNAPGLYRIDFPDAAFATGVDKVILSVTCAGCDPAMMFIELADNEVVDVYSRIGAPAGASVSADIAAVKTETASIQTDTNDIQTRIPAALVSGRMDSSVGAMAANVMTAAAAAPDLTTELQSGLSTLDAAGVRTAIGLASANLDTQLTAIDDFLDTEVAAIKAKTDNLPSDPADASDIASSFSSLNTKIDTIDDFLDTEIAAIKAKTDNLPASPAAVGSAMTLTSGERDSVADALLARNVSGGSSAGRTVKQALHALRNKHAIVAGTLTVCDTDDSTTSWTAAVTTTAGNPISSIDPA